MTDDTKPYSLLDAFAVRRPPVMELSRTNVERLYGPQHEWSGLPKPHNLDEGLRIWTMTYEERIELASLVQAENNGRRRLERFAAYVHKESGIADSMNYTPVVIETGPSA
jgi:hypothetical protein